MIVSRYLKVKEFTSSLQNHCMWVKQRCKKEQFQYQNCKEICNISIVVNMLSVVEFGFLFSRIMSFVKFANINFSPANIMKSTVTPQ